MSFNEYLKENLNTDFPPLYHGSSSGVIENGNFKTKDVYLTTDIEEAEQFAAGKHRLQNLKTKYIFTILARRGKIFDGSEEVEKIIFEEHDDFDDIDDLMEWARGKGYSYVTFSHPSMVNDGEFEVITSLNPNRDLDIFDVEKI